MIVSHQMSYKKQNYYGSRMLKRIFKVEYSMENFKMLSPFKDENGVIRVGGRVDKALMSYETQHPILLPNKHWISYLITRHMHQFSQCGTTATGAKTKQKF